MHVHCWPLLVAVVILAGCVAGSPVPDARDVSLAEFARNGTTNAAADEMRPDGADRPSTSPGPASVDEDEDDTGGDRVVEPVATPSRARPLQAGQSMIVDSLVGQINGRPIYAHDFFTGIADQLLALAEQTGSTRAFRNAAAEVIRAKLSQVVLDQLFLAEAESSLTPEQQQGVLAFMQSLREGVIGRAGGGTRADAEEALRQQEGIGVEEYVEARRDQELLRFLFQQKIESRVIVSWRDVEREYARRRGEFQPPPVAHLSRIRLDTRRAGETISEVRARLEGGEPFEQVANDVGMSDGGAWQAFELGPAGLAGIDLRDEIREHVAELEVGETSAPFEVGRSTWWLHLDRLEQKPGRSIHDPAVQRMLTSQLLARRRVEEQNRYVDSLLSEGTYEELRAIGDRLVNVAVDRFGP